MRTFHPKGSKEDTSQVVLWISTKLTESDEEYIDRYIAMSGMTHHCFVDENEMFDWLKENSSKCQGIIIDPERIKTGDLEKRLKASYPKIPLAEAI